MGIYKFVADDDLKEAVFNHNTFKDKVITVEAENVEEAYKIAKTKTTKKYLWALRRV